MEKAAIEPLPAVASFSQLVSSPVGDEQLDLLRAALMIAQAEYPRLEMQPYVDRVAALAARVKRRMPAVNSPEDAVAALNAVLFGEAGLRGNRDDYFDPRNSFLNQVLDRGLGIPITLALVYKEVAARVGFPLAGVGMPGHFLLKHFDRRGGELLIDVFESGRILSTTACQQKLDEIYSGELTLQREHLLAVSHRQWLTRMLNNLRQVYLSGRSFRKALFILDFLVALHPRSAEEIKQRAILHYNLNQVSAGLRDFEEYLRLAPNASDVDDIRHLTHSIRRTLAMLN
jgi:regulator of sirC expression with transglutaminase-like and TPR domain